MNKRIFLPIIVILIGVVITQLIAFLAAESNSFTLNYLALYTISIQWIAFLHAGGIIFGNERTEKYYDLIGSVTFMTTLLLSLHHSPRTTSWRQLILSACVGLWTVRLGGFLFTRIHKNNGKDSRFTEIKRNNFRFLMMWTLQGIWVFITLLPYLILNQRIDDHKMSAIDLLGFYLWVFGFIFEAIADYQKFKFRSYPANREKFISSGLWKFSRHPNYFGEIVLWIGIAACCFSGTGSICTFISPIFVALLLIYVSGIPSLEKKADAVYANNKQYQSYKASTPVLIPFFGRSGDAKF
jgi:steroid 5-alpha reductase family enzyme